MDRTRFLRTPAAWDSPASIVEACASQFNTDFWSTQEYRPEVWVEKDALVSVLQVACDPLHLPYFSCRGYTSDSEIWAAAQRLRRWQLVGGQTPVVIHLGDHDPSGIDMSRDILDRLALFGRGEIEVRRIALNMDQIRRLNPPPNPAKTTDARYTGYRRQFGSESWELDALDPTTITELITSEVNDLIDDDRWETSTKQRDEARHLLQEVANNWDSITEGM